MSLAAPDDHDDEEEPAEAAEADAEKTEEPADLDGDEEAHQPSLDEDGGDDADDADDEAYLEWADEWSVHEDGTLPLREAVEENGRMHLNAAQQWQLEEVKEEIEALREENRNGNENGQAQLSRSGGDRRGGPRSRRDEREEKSGEEDVPLPSGKLVFEFVLIVLVAYGGWRWWQGRRQSKNGQNGESGKEEKKQSGGGRSNGPPLVEYNGQ